MLDWGKPTIWMKRGKEWKSVCGCYLIDLRTIYLILIFYHLGF